MGDDTSQVQQMLEAAARINAVLVLPPKSYRISSISIPQGLRGLICHGTFVAIPSSTEAVIIANAWIGAPGRGSENFISVNINCENAAKRAILVRNSCNIEIRSCHLSIGETNGGEAVRVHYGSKNISVRNCVITLAGGIAKDFRDGLFGIRVFGETASSTAGLAESRKLIKLQSSTRNISIDGNSISGGTHAIAIFGASGARVLRNRCVRQAHRNIILSPDANAVDVIDNTLIDCGSSAVHCALGCENIKIHGNFIESNLVVSSHDGGALQAYLGCSNIDISQNSVIGNFRFGVYVGFECHSININNNRLDLSFRDIGCGVAIESDWTLSSHSFVEVTRRRRSPGNVKAAMPTFAISCSNLNVVGARYGIVLAQRGHARLYNVALSNIALRAAPSMELKDMSAALVVVEELSDGVSDVSLEHLSVHDSNFCNFPHQMILPRKLDHFSIYRP